MSFPLPPPSRNRNRRATEVAWFPINLFLKKGVVKVDAEVQLNPLPAFGPRTWGGASRSRNASEPARGLRFGAEAGVNIGPRPQNASHTNRTPGFWPQSKSKCG